MIDNLIQNIKSGFKLVRDNRYKNTSYDLDDYLQSAFAMFHLKDPSMHQYPLQYSEREANLQRIYDVNLLPSASALREGIDEVFPEDIQECFKIPHKVLKEHGILDDYKVLGDYQAVLFDATQHYCSAKTPCKHCLEKVHRNKKGDISKVTYSHQALGAVMAHPNNKEVFPIASEAIMKQDGSKKNDCELNASKRLIPTVRQMLPANEYKLIGVFDGLSPNGPHIKTLEEHEMSYIIGIREGYVLIQVEALRKQNKLSPKIFSKSDCKSDLQSDCKSNSTKNKNTKSNKVSKQVAHWANGLILNGQHQEILVNYFEFEEFDDKGKRLYFNAWITDIPINDQNIEELVQIGRSRWKIENETFNTLKNQGYNFEHSYGHGKNYLATNFMLLIFLAFLGHLSK